MRIFFVAAAALSFAAMAAAQGDRRPDPLDTRAKTPPVEFRSAFEDYRPYAEPQVRDWRKSNEEVGAAGGHAGQRPGQGAGKPASKPQPGHGGHK